MTSGSCCCQQARGLQAKFEAELKKARALAQTRLQERDALALQLREVQGKLKARPPSPLRPDTKRAAAAAPELSQLRGALAAAQHERDVLKGEVSALHIELEASRELLG